MGVLTKQRLKRGRRMLNVGKRSGEQGIHCVGASLSKLKCNSDVGLLFYSDLVS